MKRQIFFFIAILTLITWFSGCKDDEPLKIDLITAHPWVVDNYDIQASSSGIAVPASLLEPYADIIAEEAPIYGTFTFTSDTFTVTDQSGSVSGTWKFLNNDSQIELTFDVTSEKFVFDIVRLTDSNFDLKYTTELEVDALGSIIDVTFEITVMLIPA